MNPTNDTELVILRPGGTVKTKILCTDVEPLAGGIKYKVLDSNGRPKLHFVPGFQFEEAQWQMLP